MIDADTKRKTLGRLRRIEGQIQGLQRMIGDDAHCVDVLLQVSAAQGALEQVRKLLLGQHIEGVARDRRRLDRGAVVMAQRLQRAIEGLGHGYRAVRVDDEDARHVWPRF